MSNNNLTDERLSALIRVARDSLELYEMDLPVIDDVMLALAELQQRRAAMLHTGNSPVIPDGWVACSERMPEEGSKVIVFRPRASESNDPPVKTATYKGGREYYHGFDCYCEPTHWMPLPAAPQQEVTQALAKGMERYGDAMQKLADSGD